MGDKQRDGVKIIVQRVCFYDVMEPSELKFYAGCAFIAFYDVTDPHRDVRVSARGDVRDSERCDWSNLLTS